MRSDVQSNSAKVKKKSTADYKQLTGSHFTVHFSFWCTLTSASQMMGRKICVGSRQQGRNNASLNHQIYRLFLINAFIKDIQCHDIYWQHFTWKGVPKTDIKTVSCMFMTTVIRSIMPFWMQNMTLFEMSLTHWLETNTS